MRLIWLAWLISIWIKLFECQQEKVNSDFSDLHCSSPGFCCYGLAENCHESGKCNFQIYIFRMFQSHGLVHFHILGSYQLFCFHFILKQKN